MVVPQRPDELGDLTLRRTQVGRRIVIAAEGEIDLSSAPAVGQAVDRALTDGALELWLDFSELVFIDSQGIHLLLDVHRKVQELDRRLAVICRPGAIRRALALTGADEALPLYASREEAHRQG